VREDSLEASVEQLLAPLRANRLLHLGWRALAAQRAVEAGAHVLVVDPSEAHIEEARQIQETTNASIDFRRADVGELAFLPAESVDAAIAWPTLDSVGDLRRVLRQVNRVLRAQAHCILALTHPLKGLLDFWAQNPGATTHYLTAGSPARLRSFWTFSEAFDALGASGFSVQRIVEVPDYSEGSTPDLPAYLLFRAKKDFG
jgi:ubiquinone/menaquinone biosynthesis C-methylase UbiE